jgi:hypothetical protein
MLGRWRRAWYWLHRCINFKLDGFWLWPGYPPLARDANRDSGTVSCGVWWRQTMPARFQQMFAFTAGYSLLFMTFQVEIFKFSVPTKVQRSEGVSNKSFQSHFKNRFYL